MLGGECISQRQAVHVKSTCCEDTPHRPFSLTSAPFQGTEKTWVSRNGRACVIIFFNACTVLPPGFALTTLSCSEIGLGDFGIRRELNLRRECFQAAWLTLCCTTSSNELVGECVPSAAFMLTTPRSGYPSAAHPSWKLMDGGRCWRMTDWTRHILTWHGNGAMIIGPARHSTSMTLLPYIDSALQVHS